MKLKKSIFIGLVSIILLLIISILIFSFSVKNNGIKGKMKINFESRTEDVKNFNSGDYYTVGWLQVQGTNIDLPILDYRALSKNEEIDYSYGWRSVNYVTGENREVLAGHNILNVSSKPMLPSKELTDFEELMAFSYYGFAKDNLYVQYTKDNKDEVYAIYAIGFYDYDYDEAQSINNADKLKTYIKEAKNNSIYNYDIDVSENDSLLSIKTCTRYFGLFEKQQFIINLRKVRDDEEIVKYSVKTNDNFDKLISSDKNS